MHLFAFEQRWAHVIANALLPASALGGAVAAAEAGALIEEDCEEAPWYAAIVARLALWIVWLAPPFVGRGLHTFGGLDADAREAVLEQLLKSPRFVVRSSLYLLKLVVCTLLLGNPRALAHLGAYGLDAPAHEHKDDVVRLRSTEAGGKTGGEAGGKTSGETGGETDGSTSSTGGGGAS